MTTVKTPHITLKRQRFLADSSKGAEGKESLISAIMVLKEHLHHSSLRVKADSDFAERLTAYEQKYGAEQLAPLMLQLTEANIVVSSWILRERKLFAFYYHRRPGLANIAPMDVVCDKMAAACYGLMLNYIPKKKDIVHYISRSLSLKSKSLFTFADRGTYGLDETQFGEFTNTDGETMGIDAIVGYTLG